MCDKCKDFGHCHAHTDNSDLDGMGRVEELVSVAKSHGQTFMAVTDHGTMSGLWEAQQEGDKQGIKIIHGCEFYYEREYDDDNGHLLVLAKNNTGLQNMFRLSKLAHENFYKKPRINFDMLEAHAEGLIVTSTCLASDINQYLINGKYQEAKSLARRFQKVFGEDFYMELQPNDIPEQFIANKGSIRIAKELNIKLVATNDVHYTLASDCFPHEVLLALQVQKKMDDPKRFKFSTDGFHLKSYQEMIETFQDVESEHVCEALANTKEIADKCSARLEKGHYLPKFYDIPEGETERSILVKETIQGVKNRGMARDKQFIKQLQNEIDVIDSEGYSGYFLIVQDYVVSAKKRGEIVGDGRGSGAGCKVAWATGITEIPPHEYDLLFERFLAKGREPDFDVDFSSQESVFQDLQRKYGFENVTRIMAFGTMTPKAVTRKVLNAFGHPMWEQSQVTKLIDQNVSTIEEAYEQSPELLVFRDKYKTEFQVIERLQNVKSHKSMHAGGVLIYPNISEILPVKLDRKSNMWVAEFDKNQLAELGHFKFDILGLKTLPIVRSCVESIKSGLGIDLDLSQIDKEDQAVYDMLCKGDVSGVFQIAEQAQKVMAQKPRSFRDLIAINALIRPGVGDWDEYIERRNGKQWSVYEPRMPYMEETQGTMTYQEQYLLDAHILAGWDIAYADKKIRKNKNIREDKELREQFIQDATSNGHREDVARGVWEEIEDAVDGGYSFNKSHSASYAMLSYQTAWLKCHYPQFFYAALMSGAKTDGDGQSEIAKYIAECKQRGIEILPPDINLSGDEYVATSKGINYRITTIKHVGDSAIAHIMELRPIKSFDDFMERRNKSIAKKNIIINMIKAGCFDFDEPNRAELLWRCEMSLRTKTQIKKNVQLEKMEYTDDVKRAWEKEVLGMYLTSHPMERYSFKPFTDYGNDSTALVGGEIMDVETRLDKNKKEMAFVNVNTLHGTVRVLVFQKQWLYPQTKLIMEPGKLVLLRGKKSGDALLFDSGEELE